MNDRIPTAPMGGATVEAARSMTPRPLDTPVPTVSVRVLRTLLRLVEARGVDAPTLMATTGLTASSLRQADGRVPLLGLYAACSRAMRLTDDPALGLTWADTDGATTFAPISQVIELAPNLGDALQLLARYSGLLTDLAPHQVITEGDALVLRYSANVEAPLDVTRFVTELTLGGFVRLIRSFDVSPRAVRFAYPAPEHRARYDRFFEGAIDFDAAYSEVHFPVQALSARSPQRDDDARRALEAVAERRLERMTSAGSRHRARVEALLAAAAAPHQVEMREAAATLGMGERTLRRRLAEEGTSFKALRDAAGARVAKRMLADDALDVGEVAFRLGFSEPSAFRRAFKRWTGETPGAFQARHRSR